MSDPTPHPPQPQPQNAITPPPPPYAAPAEPGVYAPAPGPAPAYQAPGYPSQQPNAAAGYPSAYSYPYAPARKTNALAIVSFVSSLVGIILSWTFVLALGVIVGVITGHIALGQIKRTAESGRGLALAGVIIGWISIGLGVLSLLGFLAIWALVGAGAVGSSLS